RGGDRPLRFADQPASQHAGEPGRQDLRVRAGTNPGARAAQASRRAARNVAIEAIEASRPSLFFRRHRSLAGSMLRFLLPLGVKRRDWWPAGYYFLVGVARRFMGGTFGVYPRVMGNEIAAVSEILRGSQWNMTYGRGLAHERLEAEFAEASGTREAVAVASGGVALQMSLRALGLKPGDEAIHQVDTCAATAMALMNAGVTPIFAGISDQSFMLDIADVERRIGPQTKAIVATHMWGNPENMPALRALAQAKGLNLIEDACLGLGAIVDGKPAGSWGDVGVFSFGCVKPIQTGEGGMIVTSDDALARELRSLRHWGD